MHDPLPTDEPRRSGGVRRLSLSRWLVGLAIGLALYLGFVLHAGYQQLQDSLRHFRWSAVGLALCLSSINYGLRFLKWQYYLRRLGVRGIPPVESALVYLSGFVFTVTPGKIGEVFKSWVLARTHGVAALRTAPIVVAERVTDVVAMAVLVLVGSAAFTGGAVWALAGAALVAAALGLVWWEAPVRWLLGALQEHRRLRRLAASAQEVRDSLVRILGLKALLWPSLLSICGWSLEGLALFVLLGGLGVSVSVPFCLFFYATATLAGALVPVPGGLGIAEGLIREQLVRVAHVAVPTATAAMLMIRICTLWWAVLLGLLAWMVLRYRFPALRE